MIGTPFKSEDEYIQKKVNRVNKKPWEQEVRDEKGRKRFHGAFTGGFSAGYFNTVGSKEGFTPSTFVPAKRSNQSKRQQDIMDFMDEDDVKEIIGSHTITSKDEFKDINFFATTKNEKFETKPDEVSINDLLPSFNSKIGQDLMKGAGFKETAINKDNEDGNKYYRGRLEFKDNYYGYGYVPSYEDAISKNQFNSHENKNRIKFEKFENNEDLGFYETSGINEYSFEEIDVEGGSNRNQGRKNQESAPKFIKSKNKLQISAVSEFRMQKLPKEYDPFKPVTEEDQLNIVTSNKGRMNPERRFEMITEKPHKFLQNKFYSVGEINTTNTSSDKKEPSSTDQLTSKFNIQIDIPFKDDLSKVSRFAKFLAEKEGLLVADNYYIGSNLVTANEIREEKNLFQKLYDDNKEFINRENTLKGKKSTEELKINEPDNLEVKVSKIKWKPDKLLCKRYKIKDPFENYKEVNSNSKVDHNKSSVASNQAQKLSHHKTEKSEETIKEDNNEKNSFILLNAKPDLNLFSEIFGD